MTAESAEILGNLDAELSTVRAALGARFGDSLDLSTSLPLVTRIRNQYGDQVGDYSTIKSTFNTATMYNKSKFAMKEVDGGRVVPDLNHRHFTDDIPFGLVPVKDVASKLGVATPVVDEMIRWHQVLMGKEYIVGTELTGADVGETGVMGNYGVEDIDAYVAGKY